MPKQKMRGFTLGQLAFVLVLIVTVALLLFPHFAQPRECCRAPSCVSNMKNIGLGLSMYTVDYDDVLIKDWYGLPPEDRTGTGHLNWALHRHPTDIQTYSWRWAIQPYLKNINVLACPSNPVANSPELWTNSVSYANGSAGQWMPGGYAVNLAVFGFANGPVAGLPSGLTRDSDIKDPSNTIVVADTRYVWNDASIDWIAGSMGSGPSLPAGSAYQDGKTPCGTAVGPPAPPDMNDPCAYDHRGSFQLHKGFVNFIFYDSHVKALKLAATAVPNDLWNSGYTLAQRTLIVQNMRTEYE